MPISSVGRTSEGPGRLLPTRRRGDAETLSLKTPRLRVSALKTGPLAARGVTLIELLVVMAIIGLIVGISVPSVATGIDSVRLASATDSVAAFLNSAVNRAERRQQAVEVVISRKENGMAIYSVDPGPARVLHMPDGITIEGVQPAGEDSYADERRLILMPGGVVPGIGVQLGNRHGAHRVVRLDPMTGFPRVESVNQE
jgi:prepilin-type N-terminal cleavage/methylation domain-containing protein